MHAQVVTKPSLATSGQLTNMSVPSFIATEGSPRSLDYALLLWYRMTSKSLYSAQYHRQHCTFQAFYIWTVWSSVYMHNLDNKHPRRGRGAMARAPDGLARQSCMRPELESRCSNVGFSEKPFSM